MGSAMVVPLLLLKNTVDGFLCAEFRIVECFTGCSIYCVNAVRFPVQGLLATAAYLNLLQTSGTVPYCTGIACYSGIPQPPANLRGLSLTVQGLLATAAYLNLLQTSGPVPYCTGIACYSGIP